MAEKHSATTIVGQRTVDFITKDGVKMKGLSLYLGEKIPAELGAGMAVDKVFLSDAKLNSFDYKPQVGDAVEVLYNKYGKPFLIRPADDDVLIDYQSGAAKFLTERG